MIGKNVATWLEDLSGQNEKRAIKVAGHLLNTSENYFDDKKVSVVERTSIANQAIKLADNKNSEIRNCVAHLIAILNVWSEEIELTLKSLLNDADDSVATSSVWATGKNGKHSVDIIDSLVKLIDHPNREVRWRIPWAIIQIEPPLVGVKKALFALTSDKDNTAKMYALDALAACVSAPDKDIISLVKNGLKDEAGEVRGAACRLVKKIEGDWSLVKSDLEYTFKNDMHGVKRDAVMALCKRWPESVMSQDIKSWLHENQGYWWAVKLLSGEKI